MVLNWPAGDLRPFACLAGEVLIPGLVGAREKNGVFFFFDVTITTLNRVHVKLQASCLGKSNFLIPH